MSPAESRGPVCLSWNLLAMSSTVRWAAAKVPLEGNCASSLCRKAFNTLVAFHLDTVFPCPDEEAV